MAGWLRRTACAVLCAVLVMSFFGCGTKEAQPDESGAVYFTGEVTGVSNSTIRVEVTDSGTSGLSRGTEADIATGGEGGGFPALDIGDYAQITFSGEVLETYPVQIKSVIDIVRTDKSGNALDE